MQCDLQSVVTKDFFICFFVLTSWPVVGLALPVCPVVLGSAMTASLIG